MTPASKGRDLYPDDSAAASFWDGLSRDDRALLLRFGLRPSTEAESKRELRPPIAAGRI